jgi:ferrous iron transport protein A
MSLNELKSEETGVVTELLSEGAERRRMLDLGILPGTEIEVVMKSPMGDPTAYRIRDAVVALREEQAALIKIKPSGRTDQSNSRTTV